MTLLARKSLRKSECDNICSGKIPFLRVFAKEVCYDITKLTDLYGGGRDTGSVTSHFPVF
jgi:hypothetical protein